MRPMNDRQRTILVIASGLGIAVLVATINRRLAGDLAAGWFNYVPNNSESPLLVSSPDDRAVPEGVLWFLGVAVWAGLSLWLYRDPPAE